MTRERIYLFFIIGVVLIVFVVTKLQKHYSKLEYEALPCINYNDKFKLSVYSVDLSNHGYTKFNKSIEYRGIGYNIILGDSINGYIGTIKPPYVLYKKSFNDTLVLRKEVKINDSIEYKFLINNFCDTIIVEGIYWRE